MCLRELLIPYRNLSCHVGFVLITKFLGILKILMVFSMFMNNLRIVAYWLLKPEMHA